MDFCWHECTYFSYVRCLSFLKSLLVYRIRWTIFIRIVKRPGGWSDKEQQRRTRSAQQAVSPLFPRRSASSVRKSFFFFFLRYYNFREVLALSTNSFHLGRFLMQSLQFVISIFMSLFTSSSHLFLGLPSDLVSAGGHSYTFFTMLLFDIRCTCPNQASLWCNLWCSCYQSVCLVLQSI